MFNKIVIQQKEVNIPAACSGMLQKSCAESKFKRFHLRSELASMVFDNEPNLGYNKKISVLQIMVFGDLEAIIEYIDLKKMEEEI